VRGDPGLTCVHNDGNVGGCRAHVPAPCCTSPWVCRTQHSTAQDSAAQHTTEQYSTIRCNTSYCIAVQHSTWQNRVYQYSSAAHCRVSTLHLGQEGNGPHVSSPKSRLPEERGGGCVARDEPGLEPRLLHNGGGEGVVDSGQQKEFVVSQELVHPRLAPTGLAPTGSGSRARRPRPRTGPGPGVSEAGGVPRGAGASQRRADAERPSGKREGKGRRRRLRRSCSRRGCWALPLAPPERGRTGGPPLRPWGVTSTGSQLPKNSPHNAGLRKCLWLVPPRPWAPGRTGY